MPAVTRTQATEATYAERAARLYRRYLATLDLGDEGTAHEFARWMLARKHEVLAATWRKDRTAVTWALEQAGEDDAAAVLRRDALCPVEPSPRRADIEPRGPRLRAKRWVRSEFENLMAFLQFFSRSSCRLVLVDWLRAGVATGLRPCEWSAASLSGDILVVQSAKATNGRGNGGIRTLRLAGLADDDRASIRRMVARGHAWAVQGTYDAEQKAVAQLLADTVEHLWPGKRRGYALYTSRHQATANWKAIRSPEVIAALLGHSVTRTASAHYGKRRSGWSGPDMVVAPDACDSEVSTVRRNARQRPEHLLRQTAARNGQQNRDVCLGLSGSGIDFP